MFMKYDFAFIFGLLGSIFAGSCSLSSPALASATEPTLAKDALPPPFQTESVTNYSKVIGWADGKTPTAPAGFTVTKFADKLEHPRWIYVSDSGDIFVAESATLLHGIEKLGPIFSARIRSQHYGDSANRITLFRDTNKDGVPEDRFVFAENLNQPFGMLILGNHFYVGNTDGLMRFDYKTGDTKLLGKGEMILALPANAPNRHWTRNIIASRSGDRIYIGIGSSTNIAENGMDKETRRANILQVNPDGSGERIYASGLRNPVGMAWAPGTAILWAAVNERDELGDELVPDYLTSVQEGGFYGWPFAYWGRHPDPRLKDDPRPDRVSQTIVPDFSLGSHTASLGLVFYDKKAFPRKYWNGAFVTQHGSWNRKELAGYRVVYVPFRDGQPAGEAEEFLTGFKVENSTDSEVRGRPVGLAL